MTDLLNFFLNILESSNQSKNVKYTQLSEYRPIQILHRAATAYGPARPEAEFRTELVILDILIMQLVWIVFNSLSWKR